MHSARHYNGEPSGVVEETRNSRMGQLLNINLAETAVNASIAEVNRYWLPMC